MYCMVHYPSNGPMWRLWSGKLMVWALAFRFCLSHLHIFKGMSMYVQISRTLCPMLSLLPLLSTPPFFFNRRIKAEVLLLSPQLEKVMRFCAPSITRRMRNLIIKERHVAVRKICLFFSYCITPRNKGDPSVLFIKSCLLQFIKVNYQSFCWANRNMETC